MTDELPLYRITATFRRSATVRIGLPIDGGKALVTVLQCAVDPQWALELAQRAYFNAMEDDGWVNDENYVIEQIGQEA